MATQTLLDNQQLKKIMDEFYSSKIQAQPQTATEALQLQKYRALGSQTPYAWPKDSEEMKNLLKEIEFLKQAQHAQPQVKKEPTLQDIIDAEVKNLKR